LGEGTDDGATIDFANFGGGGGGMSDEEKELIMSKMDSL
jgi:hypothetical protein